MFMHILSGHYLHYILRHNDVSDICVYKRCLDSHRNFKICME